MNRRDFLNRAAQGAVVAGTAGLAIETIRDRPDPYQPCGLLTADSVGAHDVGYVTLDGVRVEHVTALNDVEGWLEHLDPISKLANGRLRTYHREGVVRVHWKVNA